MENWPKVIAIWGLELAIERLRHWDPTIQALFSNPWVTIGTWMTSFIVQLKKGGWEGLSLGPKRERERDWGVQRGRRLWRKERDRKTCLWPKAFPSPNPLFYFFFFFFLLRWVSNLEEPPSEEQTAEGLRRHPKPLCEVFIKSQWLAATSSQLHSLPSYTTEPHHHPFFSSG